MTTMSARSFRLALLVGLAFLASMLVSLTAAAPSQAATASNGYPYCSSSSSDPDGDGWGWENNQSCVVKGSKADPGGSSSSSSGYPTCASSSSDPDGDGWGWENNATCKVGSSSSGGSTSGSSGYPTCSSSSSDPDGDGWGWENNASCKVGSSSGNGSSSGGSSSTSCPSGATCGSYSISGLGSRKQQILSAGGNTLDLATAMLESDNMTANYGYGDYKTYDAANFGIFKQNWGMLRVACSRFKGQSVTQWNNGAVLNSNLSADITCLHQSQSYWGTDTWFAGHRNGSTGLANPNTSDIKAYRAAVYWIQAQLKANSANLSNNTRFWVNVPAI
jgi:hypothetical protein